MHGRMNTNVKKNKIFHSIIAMRPAISFYFCNMRIKKRQRKEKKQTKKVVKKGGLRIKLFK